MKTHYIDLVLLTGEIVRIEVPEDYHDEAHATIESAMKRRDWWSPAQFNRAKMEFMGLRIDRLNMAQVVAML